MGDNPYGRRFAEHCLDLTKTERSLAKAAGHFPIESGDWETVVELLHVLRSPTTALSARVGAINGLREVCESSILPAIESVVADPFPTSEHVLPTAVVAGTRPYIERVVLEANGCYEHHMVQRLLCDDPASRRNVDC